MIIEVPEDDEEVVEIPQPDFVGVGESFFPHFGTKHHLRLENEYDPFGLLVFVHELWSVDYGHEDPYHPTDLRDEFAHDEIRIVDIQVLPDDSLAHVVNFTVSPDYDEPIRVMRSVESE